MACNNRYRRVRPLCGACQQKVQARWAEKHLLLRPGGACSDMFEGVEVYVVGTLKCKLEKTISDRRYDNDAASEI